MKVRVNWMDNNGFVYITHYEVANIKVTEDTLTFILVNGDKATYSIDEVLSITPDSQMEDNK